MRICSRQTRGESVTGGAGTRPRPASSHKRTTACLALQMLTWPDLRDAYHPGKLATTETRQAFTRGSVRVTLPFGASGPERVTTFAPTRTATAVAGTARPFTIVSVVAERGVSRRPAKRPLRGGDVGAGEATGAADGGAGSLSAGAGGGAGAVSTGLVFSLTGDGVGAARAGVDGSASSGGGEGGAGAGGAAGTSSTGSAGATSGRASACATAAGDDSVAATTTKARVTRVNGRL
jgi:hypothetical protein